MRDERRLDSDFNRVTVSVLCCQGSGIYALSQHIVIYSMSQSPGCAVDTSVLQPPILHCAGPQDHLLAQTEMLSFDLHSWQSSGNAHKTLRLLSTRYM